MGFIEEQRELLRRKKRELQEIIQYTAVNATNMPPDEAAELRRRRVILEKDIEDLKETTGEKDP